MRFLILVVFLFSCASVREIKTDSKPEPIKTDSGEELKFSETDVKDVAKQKIKFLSTLLEAFQ